VGSAARKARRSCSGWDDLDIDIPVLHDAHPTRSSARRSSSLRPSGPQLERLVEGTDRADEVLAYAKVAGARPTEDREGREKSGGLHRPRRDQPCNGEPVTIWVRDYVLMEYGTGAIMAVPAHASATVSSPRSSASRSSPVIDEDETLINSGEFDGLPAGEAKRAIVEWA